MKPINRVVPAILTDDLNALTHMARQVEIFTDWVQIDIMDGRFVPSLSVNAGDIIGAGIKVSWEAHLMVENPEWVAGEYIRAGAKRIIVHYEAIKMHAIRTIRAIKDLGVKVGVAINPETAVDNLDALLVSKMDSVLFMAVHPGFYGAKFIPEVLEKIQEFRSCYPDMSIGIDGGIKADNIIQAAAAGANEICVGSAIFKQSDQSAAYHELLKRARQGWQTPGLI